MSETEEEKHRKKKEAYLKKQADKLRDRALKNAQTAQKLQRRPRTKKEKEEGK